jgi:hypothetical protein
MAEHVLHMEVKLTTGEGWEAANEVALRLGESLMFHPEVTDVEGHLDPEVKKRGPQVERRYLMDRRGETND